MASFRTQASTLVAALLCACTLHVARAAPTERMPLFGSFDQKPMACPSDIPYTGTTPMIEDCLAKYPDGTCPKPFPTYATSDETEPYCELAVVGGGTGGLYTAMRLVDTGKMAASSICIFEMTNRVGGRLYSLRGLGPDKDLSVDIGGYRTWTRFTPVLHALITEYLNIPMDCYQPPANGSDVCELWNIIGEDGKKAGFATYVEVMMEKLITAGARYFPNKELLSFTQETMSGDKTLHFPCAFTATAKQLVLNVPQRPLLNILRASSMPEGALSADMWEALHSVQTEIVSKLYLYYESAWWLDLGFEVGDFALPGDASRMPLQGRYHDGQVECDGMGKCHGFLLASYIHDYGGETAMYFRRYQAERPEPVTIISEADIEGKLFLDHAHERLIELHTYGQTTVPPYLVNQVMKDIKPKFGILGTWNIATRFAGGGWHGWTSLAMTDKAMDPLGAYGVYTVNEAYSYLQGWAEGSLMAADELLKMYFDVEPPWDFDVSPIVQVVRQTSPQNNCVEDEETGGGGGISTGGSDADALCFTKDAKLHLANGTLININKARKGDKVWTGAATGIITDVLVHPVKATVEVAVVPSKNGELIGTPSHPVKVGGKWLEIREAHAAGALPGVKFEQRYIDTYYNLEIDGHTPGLSEHAYVLNGVVVSGLGDSQVLNTMMPRQGSWKDKASAANKATDMHDA